jgi:RNA polymerase sigma-70 factor (ECF subfamily)
MDLSAATRLRVDRLDFEDFYAAEYGRVLASAYAFCRHREAALDATQEAFVRAFARWRRLEGEEWAGAWVTTTALNVLRRRARKTPALVPEPAPSGSGSLGVDVLDALRSLPARQRQAAALFYVADLPIAVVARSMGLSEGTVKTHLSRARRALRASLGGDDGR